MISSNAKQDLEQSLFKLHTQIASTRASLSAIAAYGRSTSMLRRSAFILDRRLDFGDWYSRECLTEAETILEVAKRWVVDGSERCLIWQEGCPHEGWYETVLPYEIELLDKEWRALGKFCSSLKASLDLKSAIEMISELRL